MTESNANIHTEFHRLLGTEAKEALLQQRGVVVWMYGMSGSGQSTLASPSNVISMSKAVSAKCWMATI